MQQSDSNPSPIVHDVVTVDELADYLRLDRKAVYDAIRRGEIPGVRRIGKVYRISRHSVTHWLAGTGAAPHFPITTDMHPQNLL
jgi:excisionase family DNA binding protein